MCNSTNRGGNGCGGRVSAGEEVAAGAEAGLVLGRAEAPSATYRHGRDQVGCLALAGEPDGGAIHTFVPAFLGFRDGGGLILLSMDTTVILHGDMGTPAMHPLMGRFRSTHMRYIDE